MKTFNLRLAASIGCATLSIATAFAQNPTGNAGNGVSILTFHGDNARLGWNNRETILRPDTVTPTNFGKLWEAPLDDLVHGSPLYVWGLDIGGKRQDVVFAATNRNSVYALSATNGKILWASKEISPPLTDGQYGGGWRPDEKHGILSTPVIDAKAGAIYVCLARAAGLKQIYQVWGLNIRTGKTLPGWPVTLNGSYHGAHFRPGQLIQRGALLLQNDWVYVPFGGRGDIPPWRGWVMGVNTKNPSSQQRVFCTSTTTDGAGIWSAGGVSAAPNGDLFIITGNGDYDFPKGDNLAQSVVRLQADKTGLNFSRQSKDFYTPANHLFLDEQDEDLGGATGIILPDQPGTSTPHLLFTGGKDGCAYLLNRDNLGGIGGELLKKRYFCDPNATYHEGIRATPAYFDAGAQGRFLFVTGDNPGPDGNLGMVALRIAPETPGGPMRFSRVWTLPRQLIRPSSPVVTSNGSRHGLVWVVEPQSPDNPDISILHVYDALTGKETFHSEANGANDRLVGGRIFTSVTVANGRAFVGARGVFCYGPGAKTTKTANAKP